MIEKITEKQVEEYGVVNAPDKLTGTAGQNKEVFDRLVKQIVVTVVNRVVEELNAATATLDETKHTHKNKDLLDTYTQTEANLKDAVSKKHSHSNKAVLDKLTAEQQAVLAGILGVTQSLGNSPDRVPSEKAVADAMAASGSIPSGGTKGQALVKNSATARDVTWADMLPIIDARSAEYDMTAILTGGEHCALYRTNVETKGTPRELLGLEWNRSLILSCAVAYTTYGFQVAFIDGSGGIYWRAVEEGAVSAWEKLHTNRMDTLLLSSGLAEILWNGNTLWLSSYSEAGKHPKSRHLLLQNEAGEADVAEALQLWCGNEEGTAFSKYKIYGEHNLNANIPTYTSVTQFGLSSASFIEESCLVNIDQCVSRMKDKGEFVVTAAGTNFTRTLIAKINEDVGENIAPDCRISVRIKKLGSSTDPAIVDVVCDDLMIPNRYTTVFNKTSEGNIYNGKFIKTIDEAGFLPGTGGELTGDLTVRKGSPKVNLANTANGALAVLYAYAHALQVQVCNVEDDGTKNCRILVLRDSANDTNPALSGALILRENVNGNTANYIVHHAANKPTGTYTGTGKARTISVGGIGKALLVQCSAYTALVTPLGAFIFENDDGYVSANSTSSTYIYRFSESGTYADGSLTLGADSRINDSSYDYTYQDL